MTKNKTGFKHCLSILGGLDHWKLVVLYWRVWSQRWNSWFNKYMLPLSPAVSYHRVANKRRSLWISWNEVSCTGRQGSELLPLLKGDYWDGFWTSYQDASLQRHSRHVQLGGGPSADPAQADDGIIWCATTGGWKSRRMTGLLYLSQINS